MAVVTLPAAVAAAQFTEEVELPDAAFAIPVAAALGITAYFVGRRAHRRVERTIGRVGGRRVAWAGKALGALALALSTSAAVAVATYVVLGRLAD